MKFQISTLELKKALDIVNHATANVTTTPILENILIEVTHKTVTLVSNNLEMAIEYTISESISIGKEGSFSVPSKIFTNYIGLVGDDAVNIELLDDANLHIISDSGNVKIKGMDASDFPLVPPIKEEVSFDLTGNILKKSIEKTLFSSAEGNIRPTLAGIYLHISGNEIIFASTDSLRLSEFKIQHEKNFGIDFSQIIPGKTCNEVSKIVGEGAEIKIVSGDNQIAFYTGNIKIYSRLLNGSFPDYSGFFPTSFDSKVVVNKYDLIGALRKINLISRENNFSIKVSLSKESGLLLETSETQIGEGKISLIGSVDGEDNIIGINSTFFLEVLGVIETSHISISFEGVLSPILILPVAEDGKKMRGEYRHIIMPLKI